MFRKKNGEITSQQIVILVIIIASFAVILFFLFRLNLGETTDEELCHNSVLTRGSAVVATEAVPLNCHRKYVCLTAKGGTCEGLTNPERIEVNSVDEVYQNLAEQMANCWWMFGEGKINYIGNDLTHNNYCSICSQVYLDKSLQSITGDEISKDNLYGYLEKTKIDETNTYSEYLFGAKSLDSIKQSSSNANGVGTFGRLELGKQYFVMMGITSNVGVWNWAALGSGSVGGATAIAVGTVLTVSSPVGWVVGAAIIGGAAGSFAVNVVDSINPEIAAITLDGRGIDNKFMAPTIIEANSDKFNALNCQEIVTLA